MTKGSISVKLGNTMSRRLEAAISRTGLSTSEIVRVALNDWLDKKEKEMRNDER